LAAWGDVGESFDRRAAQMTSRAARATSAMEKEPTSARKAAAWRLAIEELRRSRLVVSEVGLSDGEAQGGEG